VCPNCKTDAPKRTTRVPAIEKNKRVYYCSEYCQKCGYTYRTWKEG
jgi:hypothetical protein